MLKFSMKTVTEIQANNNSLRVEKGKHAGTDSMKKAPFELTQFRWNWL